MYQYWYYIPYRLSLCVFLSAGSSTPSCARAAVATKIEADGTDQLIRLELDGVVDTKQMLDGVEEILRLIGGRRGYDFLSDHRKLTTPATAEQIKAVLARLGEQGDLLKGSKFAVIVGQGASYGMMRLMGVHAMNLGIEVGVFWTEEEALKFLGRSSPSI